MLSMPLKMCTYKQNKCTIVSQYTDKSFLFCFFGHEACRILAPQPGIEPAFPALEGKVLTTGLPRKSLQCPINGFACSVVSDSLQPHGL